MKRSISNSVLICIAVVAVSWTTQTNSISQSSETTIAPAETAARQTDPGEAIYLVHCASCHQRDAGGVPNMAPPLIETKYILGDKTRLIKIVLEGLRDDIEINGEHFTNPMPPFSRLKDQEVADVLTYIRSNFGNKADSVSVAEVKAVRDAITTTGEK